MKKLAILLHPLLIIGALVIILSAVPKSTPAPAPPSINIGESRNVNGITVTVINVSGRYCVVTSTGGITQLD